MKKETLITILLIVIVGAATFFGGMKYQENKRPSFLRQINRQLGQGQRVGINQMGFRPLNGEIISSDDKSITVKLPDNSSKIVLFSEKMTINKAADASKEDLKVAEKVAVFGIENSDGSITAQTIQLNPIQRNFPSLIPTQQEEK